MAHSIVWFDLPVKDLRRAMVFYKHVLGIEINEAFPGVAVFEHGDNDVAGCLFSSQEAQPSQTGALLYFNVNGRLSEAIYQTQQLGGSVLQAAHDIGAFGRRAIVLDCEGNRIALHSES